MRSVGVSTESDHAAEMKKLEERQYQDYPGWIPRLAVVAAHRRRKNRLSRQARCEGVREEGHPQLSGFNIS